MEDANQSSTTFELGKLDLNGLASSEGSVNPSNQSLNSVLTDQPGTEQNNSMGDYYQLQKTLLLATFICTGIIFIPVWVTYSLNIALNYLLGACVGIVYLKMLAREVEFLGTSQQRVGTKGLALCATLIIIASQWQQLHILPVFLGFLTYKVAILAYTLKTVLNQT